MPDLDWITASSEQARPSIFFTIGRASIKNLHPLHNCNQNKVLQEFVDVILNDN
jgi:hypothetical protein